MPRGVYDRKPKADIEAAGGTPPPPVRSQIKNMSGHASAESLLSEIPDNTNVSPAPGGVPGEKTKKPKKPKSDDPNMDDPRYARIVGGYVGAGGQAVVSGLFEGASVALKDETVKLNPEEEQRVDDYFYVAGKKAKIDPTSTLVGMIIIFLVLIGSLVLPRLMKHTDLGKQLKELFKPKPKPGVISKEEAQLKTEDKP